MEKKETLSRNEGRLPAPGRWPLWYVLVLFWVWSLSQCVACHGGAGCWAAGHRPSSSAVTLSAPPPNPPAVEPACSVTESKMRSQRGRRGNLNDFGFMRPVAGAASCHVWFSLALYRHHVMSCHVMSSCPQPYLVEIYTSQHSSASHRANVFLSGD